MSWMDCRNIFLLVKEAVNNAIKHADAGKITVDIQINQSLLILIQDDGKDLTHPGNKLLATGSGITGNDWNR